MSPTLSTCCAVLLVLLFAAAGSSSTSSTAVVTAFQQAQPRTIRTRQGGVPGTAAVVVAPPVSSSLSSSSYKYDPDASAFLLQHRAPWSSTTRSMASFVLNMAGEDEDEGDQASSSSSSSSSSLEAKGKGRKKRVIMGYRVSSASNLLVGMFTVTMASLSGTVSVPTAAYYAAGPIMASGVSYILVDAATNDRLGSDTYKRLNVMLSKYGALWLLAAALSFTQPAPRPRAAKVFTNPVVVLAAFAAFVNGLKGFAYGVKGWTKQGDKGYVDELIDMTKSVPKILFSIKNLVGTGYIVATAMAGTMTVLKFLEILKLAVAGASVPIMISTRLSRLAKLSMMTGTLFTLKDAADRNRLSGKTFIELNFLTGAVFASYAGKIVELRHA